MKLCRHDWYVHKIQEGNSLRHELIIGSRTIPWLTFGLCYALGMAVLNLTPLKWFFIPIVGMALGSLILCGIVMFADIFIDSYYDPWRVEDKSCLKCGKIKFTATMSEAKVRRRIERREKNLDNKKEKKRKANLIRNKNLKLIESRYRKLLELQKG